MALLPTAFTSEISVRCAIPTITFNIGFDGKGWVGAVRDSDSRASVVLSYAPTIEEAALKLTAKLWEIADDLERDPAAR